MSDTILPCRHRRTVYNERDDTLFCLSCGCWVLPEDSALGQRLKVQHIDGTQRAD